MKKIIIVDDGRVSRQFILGMHTDWSIEETATGEEAIAKLDTFLPDLILLDVNMPGMGGFAAVEKLREKCPSALITPLTTNVQDATRARASSVGVNFAEKPITEDRIRQIISVLEG